MGYVKIALTILSRLNFFTLINFHFSFEFSSLTIAPFEKQTVADMFRR